MVKVKICGITNIDDALHAAGCGADALGLVFYEKSPRCVAPQEAAKIVSALPPMVTTFGLFVNEQPQRVAEIVAFCGLDVIQLHGDEPPSACHFPPHRVVKALRVQQEQSLADIDAYPASAILLDAWVAGRYGGTGHRLDWDLAARVAGGRRIILAGGLTPDNVAEAVATVRPYAVDVSSGVEAEPGVKDAAKVAAFIRNAKTAWGTP